LVYSALAAGQTMTVKWIMTSGNGNVTVNGAALAGANLTATGGAPQSTAMGTAFGTALQATLTDAGSHPLSGVTVLFTAPGGGPSASFSGSATATAETDSNGIATAPTLTANGQAGGFIVTATVTPGAFGTASFNLTTNGGAPSSIAATGGASQQATVNTAFGTALQATVKDAGNNLLSGIAVTFTTPNGGAGAAFGGSSSAVAVSNGSGMATAPVLTANGQPGPYTVIASVVGATGANFSLINNAVPASGTLSGSGTSATAAANLTAEGPSDWVHWGEASVNRKAGVTAKIAAYTVVGSGTVQTYNNDLRRLSWTDGSPLATGTNNANGIYISRAGSGFSITALADASARTLTLHLGGYQSGGMLTAHLSDGSAPDFIDVTPAASGQYDRNYTLVYNALSAGQTVTVKWVMVSGNGDGNVTLNGAALAP
jgi:hypothetical protein